MKKNRLLYLFVAIIAIAMICALIGCDVLPEEIPSGNPSGSPDITEPSGSPDITNPSGAEVPDDKKDPSGEEPALPTGPIVHTVSINGETCLVLDGETVPEPQITPSQNGKYFIGWYVGEEEYDFSSPVTSDLTIDAKWEDNKNLVVGRIVAYDGGDLDGAIIKLGDNSQSTTIDSDGSFALGNVAPGAHDLIIEKSGYVQEILSVEENDYDYTAQANVGTIELIRLPSFIGSIGGNKSPAEWDVFVTRSSAGIIFNVTTSIDNASITEDSNYHIETYFSIGETSSATRNNDVYYVKFFLNGKTSVYNFPENVGTCLETLTSESSVVRGEWSRTDTEITGNLFIDYDTFKLDSESSAVSPYDVLGITLLAGSTGSSIDTWIKPDMPGYTSNEVVRGNRYDYLRLDKYNNLYENTENKEVWIIKGIAEEGVTVSYGEVRVTSDNSGTYKIVVPDNGDEVIRLTYSRVGYESVTKAINVDHSDRYYNAEDVVMVAATGNISGIISDGNNLLSGAKVSYGEQSTYTDNEGRFVLENVPMNVKLSFTVSLSGYVERNINYEVSEINGEGFVAEVEMVEESLSTIVGVVSDINGTLSGASVTIKGTAYGATTDSDGAFRIEDIAAGDYEIEVSEPGYIGTEKTICAENFSSDEVSLGSVFLTKEYLDLGTISADTMTYRIYMTRNEDGFLIKFISQGTSSSLSTERVECWFSVGETPSATRNYDTWMLCYYGNKSFYLANFPNNVQTKVINNTTSSDYITASWIETDGHYEINVFVKYEAFGLDTVNGSYEVNKTDIVGITYTINSNKTGGYYYRSDMPGASNSAEVVRGNRYDYLRIDSNNNLFVNTKNEPVSE